MATKVQILLNFDKFEEFGQISYEVLVNNKNFTKDKLKCPYCTETIDVKFSIVEEHLHDENVAIENTEVLKESLLNELYEDLEENEAKPSLKFLSGDEIYVSDSDETLSSCTLLNIKYQKEIEDAIASMKIENLDESSLINFIEEKILEEPPATDLHFEPKVEEIASPVLDPDSTKILSDDECKTNTTTESSNNNDENVFHLCPCKRVYKVKKFFLKHMKQYHPDFPLDDCETVHREALKTEKVRPKRDGNRPIHRCNMCEKVYWSRRSYRRHMVCCHPEEAQRLNLQAKTYRCQYCDKIYFTSELLNQHLLLHVNPDHYQCGYCSKSFATHNNLKRHINAVHLRIKSYICEVCGVRFNQRYSLRLHHQELHGTDGFQCNDCGKIYGTKDKLKIHIKWTHYGYGKIDCKICGKTFLINNYKRHLRDVHKEGKQLEYPCRFCEKIFNRRAYRDIHECTHTGEKRYPCKICNERFTDPGYRYAHMRRCHSPEFDKRKRRKVTKNDGGGHAT